MVEIATSLLSLEKEENLQTLYNLEVAGTDYFHIDVMDGKFVKKDTTDLMRRYTETIEQITTTPIEVHLMVEDVEAYVKAYVDMGVKSITFHIESCKREKEIRNLIAYIKEHNIQVGLTLKPNTNIEEIYPYLPYLHRVLVMSVEPGAGGQEFIEGSIEKIRKLNAFAYENGYDITIEVDGGMNEKTVPKVVEAGADIVVVGSYMFQSNNYKETIAKLKA